MSSYTIKKISSSVEIRNDRSNKNKQVKFAIILLFVGIILSFLFTFFNVSTNQAYEKFVDSLKVNNFTNAIVHLEAFDRVFKSKYSKFNSKESNNLPSADDRKNFIVSLIKVLSQLSNNDRQEQRKALLTIKGMLNNVNKLTAGVGGRNARFKQTVKQDYEKLVKDYKELRKKEIVGPFRKKENQNRIYQQSVLSQDLANEFGALMGIAPQTLRGPSDQTKFYESGALKGLPVLNGLPDDMKDMKQLKVELEKLRGEVSLRGGADTPELFQKRLEEIRVKCNVFSGQIKKLTVESDDYSGDITKLEANFLKSTTKFTMETKNFIVDYVHPYVN